MPFSLNFLKKPTTFVLLGLVLYFCFGLINITEYHTADEHFWLPNYGSERVQEYWRAITEGDWKDTRINDKPGVSTAILSGIALPFVQNIIPQQIIFDDGTVKRFNPDITEQINFAFRFPLLLFNGLFIFYFFWILRKITHDDWVSAWASIFILLSPITLGISQIVNPDTLFWSLGSGALFTFFAYLQGREMQFAWMAMILFGGTLLSKYVGLIFFPFFFAMIAIDYLFRFGKTPSASVPTSPPLHGKTIIKKDLSHIVKKDILAYTITTLGGVLLFILLMPAALVDWNIFYESTIGFPGMLPIISASALSLLILLIDAIFFRSIILTKILSFLAPKKEILEKILYAMLLTTIAFTIFNWMSRNSIVDLSHIPFDSKTKASFTTENPYLARFTAEWVPLTFALTPITLFLLIFTWAQGLFGALRRRALTFTLSLFFLVFFIAVIEQGLLVTVRYSIILFPLTFILGSLSLRSLFSPKTKREYFFSKYIALTIIFSFLLFLGVLLFHDSLTASDQIIFKNFIGNNRSLLLFLVVILVSGFFFLLKKTISRIALPNISPAILSLVLLLISSASLVGAYPHYFIYTNTLFPDRYLLFHSWGYGGYEAAQYLNAKPNAENLILWTDSYGVCEFFVGKCIKKQKVNIQKYPVDYILRTLRGQIAPKFPHNREEKPEWEYAVGGRSKNFVRIYKNLAE